MPYNQPGQTHVGPVTADTLHGDPVVIEGFAGIAHKIDQALAITDPTAAAQITAAETIKSGDNGLVRITGIAEVRTELLPDPPSPGQQLWIDPADNTLKDAGATGLLKFGIVDSGADDPYVGVAKVNLSARGGF